MRLFAIYISASLYMLTILVVVPNNAQAILSPESATNTGILLILIPLISLLIFCTTTLLTCRKKNAELKESIVSLEKTQRETEERTKELLLHEHMFKEIISRSQDGFIRRSLDGVFVYANSAFLDLTGYSKEEMAQTSIDNVIPNEWQSWSKFKSIQEQVILNGFSAPYITEYKRKDGTIFSGEIRTYLLRDRDNVPIETCSFIRDISYIKDNEISMQNTITELEHILDSSPDAMRITDTKHNIIRVNHAFADLLGKTKEELIGKRCNGIFDDDLCKAVDDIFETFRKKDSIQIPGSHVSINNKDMYCELTATAIKNSNNEIIGMLSDFHDFTDRQKIEEALRVSEQRFRSFFEASRDSVMIMDEAGTIIDCNKAAQETFGINDQSALFGRSFHSLSPIRQADGRKSEDKSLEWFASTQTVGSSFFEWHFKKSDSTVFPAEVLLSTIDLSGVTFHHGVIRNISDRKNVEAAREESERRLELALEATDEGIIDWDFNKNKYYFSSRFFNMLGYSQTNTPATYNGYLDRLHPDDRLKFENEFNEFLKGEMISFSTKVRIATGEEDWLWILCRCKAVKYDRNGTVTRVIGSNVNIQELKEIEEALRKSEEDYRTLIESANSIIMRVDVDGKILFINPFAEQLLGYSLNNLSKKTIFSLFAQPQQDDTRNPMEEIISKIALAPEIEINSSFALKRWTTWSAKTITNDLGQTKEYLFIGQDISAKRRAEERAKQQHEQLIHADKLKSLGTLVAGVAHEVNNPNSFIMLNTPILREMWEEIIPVIKEYAHDKGRKNIGRYPVKRVIDRVPLLLTGIADGSQRIKDIVANLKDFSRQEPEEKGQHVNINDIARAAVELVNNKIAHSTRHFKMDLTDSEVPFWGSFQKLEQVIINLLINACESLTSLDKKVTLTTTFDENSDVFFLQVIDEGIGIKKEEMAQIFDPFFTTKRERGGTGLGLSISSGIIEEHGGTLTFQSIPDRGTTVTIQLPREKSTVPQQ